MKSAICTVNERWLEVRLEIEHPSGGATERLSWRTPGTRRAWPGTACRTGWAAFRRYGDLSPRFREIAGLFAGTEMEKFPSTPRDGAVGLRKPALFL